LTVYRRQIWLFSLSVIAYVFRRLISPFASVCDLAERTCHFTSGEISFFSDWTADQC
jgi:hypothetical protein